VKSEFARTEFPSNAANGHHTGCLRPVKELAGSAQTAAQKLAAASNITVDPIIIDQSAWERGVTNHGSGATFKELDR
jgi:hypothetical protein